MKTVQVLLSAYNGAKYIKQQIDSVFAQQQVEVHCLVRDDGSNDETLSVINDCRGVYQNLEIIQGENIGYGSSFLELIKESSDFDYYAFADQDDVWQPLKLISAIEMLAKEGDAKANMYFSNCTVVNDRLETIRMLHLHKNHIPNHKKTALVQGFVHGCTMVFNNLSKELVLKHKPSQKYAHDFWIPLLHVFFGNIIYDFESHILYRQHNQNVFGGKRSVYQLIKIKLSFLTHSENYYLNLANDLINGYKELMTDDVLLQLSDIADYKKSLNKRIKLIFDKKIRRNTLRGTVFLKILILTSKF
jgi:glycosyltransferase involved in cell wall biosynthesis